MSSLIPRSSNRSEVLAVTTHLLAATTERKIRKLGRGKSENREWDVYYAIEDALLLVNQLEKYAPQTFESKQSDP